MEMAIRTSFPVSQAQTADALRVWVMMTRSEKSRRADLRGFTEFLWTCSPFLVPICPSNRPTSQSTDSQPEGTASTDDGTVFLVTANGVEVYYGENVGKMIADLQLKANLSCMGRR